MRTLDNLLIRNFQYLLHNPKVLEKVISNCRAYKNIQIKKLDNPIVNTKSDFYYRILIEIKTYRFILTNTSLEEITRLDTSKNCIILYPDNDNKLCYHLMQANLNNSKAISKKLIDIIL